MFGCFSLLHSLWRYQIWPISFILDSCKIWGNTVKQITVHTLWGRFSKDRISYISDGTDWRKSIQTTESCKGLNKEGEEVVERWFYEIISRKWVELPTQEKSYKQIRLPEDSNYRTLMTREEFDILKRLTFSFVIRRF